MLDYTLFDSILDAVFVIDPESRVLYCNDAAAVFCQSSVRRLQGKAKLNEILSLAVPDVFPFSEKSPGFSVASSFLETDFEIARVGRKGRLQFAIRPAGPDQWFFYVRDVSLEEALHSKYRSELSQKEKYIGELEEARQELEDYSRNLEKIVENRTMELRKANTSLDAILNSSGQGFFTFSRSGFCGDVFTKSCEILLGAAPAHRAIREVLKIPDNQFIQFKKWMEVCFSESLPFDDLKYLGPATVPHAEGLHVSLEYYPIRNENRGIESIVVVATDRTAEHKAQMALEEERQYASMVVKYLRNRDQFQQFLLGTRRSLAELLNSFALLGEKKARTDILRILHTIEGEAGAFSVQEIRSQARALQSWLDPSLRLDRPWTDTDSAGFRDLLVQFSQSLEDFLKRNKDVIRLPQSGDSRVIEINPRKLEKFFSELKEFRVPEDVTRPVEDDLLLETVESRLSHYDGVVQAVARNLGKILKPLEFANGELRVVPQRFQSLFSTLVHVFRNAVDHGIEDPDEREMVGKSREGRILVEVERVGSNLRLRISDDGRGIDVEPLRMKLRKKFPEIDFSVQDDEAVLQNIFRPGFTSRDAVGEFSGRGVGLDALHEEVVKLGGTVRVESRVGEGSRFEIVVPLQNQGYTFPRSA